MSPKWPLRRSSSKPRCPEATPIKAEVGVNIEVQSNFANSVSNIFIIGKCLTAMFPTIPDPQVMIKGICENKEGVLKTVRVKKKVMLQYRKCEMWKAGSLSIS